MRGGIRIPVQQGLPTAAVFLKELPVVCRKIESGIPAGPGDSAREGS